MVWLNMVKIVKIDDTSVKDLSSYGLVKSRILKWLRMVWFHMGEIVKIDAPG
jgi:hypothetical protein